MCLLALILCPGALSPRALPRGPMLPPLGEDRLVFAAFAVKSWPSLSSFPRLASFFQPRFAQFGLRDVSRTLSGPPRAEAICSESQLPEDTYNQVRRKSRRNCTSCVVPQSFWSMVPRSPTGLGRNRLAARSREMIEAQMRSSEHIGDLGRREHVGCILPSVST